MEWTLLLRTNLLPSPLSTYKSDADVNPFAPICIGMDYNANINWIVAGLPDGRKLNIINSFYVKFERHGWTVEAVYIGNPMRHDKKYLLINQAFASNQRLMPFINRQNNDDRILSLQSASVTRIRKDKAGEKLAESEEDLLKHLIDGPDAFDTLYIVCEKFPYRETYSINVSGVL